jgi:hypothetical protein
VDPSTSVYRKVTVPVGAGAALPLGKVGKAVELGRVPVLIGARFGELKGTEDTLGAAVSELVPETT